MSLQLHTAVITSKYFLPAFKDEKCRRYYKIQHLTLPSSVSGLIELALSGRRTDFTADQPVAPLSLSVSLSLLINIVLHKDRRRSK